ncbi:uncharacterized protein LOC118753587 [Rhagoletis pomonella]|uniref:uncharacterized protein LOC118753587 n=1 Tax=Rhagoletis pomonella TaxID=28610 RepID=UPI001785AFAB|nr:uncharacterized protein LOC118753587 [Rhagoletis pomonella]
MRRQLIPQQEFQLHQNQGHQQQSSGLQQLQHHQPNQQQKQRELIARQQQEQRQQILQQQQLRQKEQLLWRQHQAQQEEVKRDQQLLNLNQRQDQFLKEQQQQKLKLTKPCKPRVLKRIELHNSHNQKIARPSTRMLSKPFKLCISETELSRRLRCFTIKPNFLRVYGYPVESVKHKGKVEIFKGLPDSSRASNSKSKLEVANFGLHLRSYSASSTDSGHGSSASSSPNADSDSSETSEDEPIIATAYFTGSGRSQVLPPRAHSLRKQCVRCLNFFNVTDAGTYLKRENCTFHWGKIYELYNDRERRCIEQYTCCFGTKDAAGCTRHPQHVWTGVVAGFNGPYSDFVHTRPHGGDKGAATKVYALDCEMSFTGRGLEVTKVTVIGYDGQVVYEHFVRPFTHIIDYNTRFSGITEKDLCKFWNNDVKTLTEVQRDLLNLFDADTILIGHGLENDLRVLRMVHKTVVDTSIVFPHRLGFPYRRSLKHLTKSYLKRDIQVSGDGHDSLEDTRACLELMLWKLDKEMRTKRC